MQQIITSTYEHELANAYYRIDGRGILTNPTKLRELDGKIQVEVKDKLDKLSSYFNTHIYLGRENDPGSGDRLNLNTPGKVLDFLKQRGFKILKTRKKNQETREVEFKESVDELCLRKMFAEASPDQVEQLKLILDIRELNTISSRYIHSKKHENVFYSCRNVAGTLTGRRSSKKNCFGLGGNDQNFPKHSNNPFIPEFRSCLIARPHKLFFFVDQMSAEEWPVAALSMNHGALDELRRQEDRHTKFAAFIFSIPIDSKTKAEWKASIERYLGKKCRHAKNYRMQAQMMSDSLAKEGYSVSATKCKILLDKASQFDPSVENVFHAYVIATLFRDRKLVTPLGRERYFLGLRPNDDNHRIVNEACAYIPQSTVADNTGLSILWLDRCNDFVVHECHDSIGQELDDDYPTLLKTFNDTRNAFDRKIKFHNGIEIQIPIEAEIGYDFHNTITLKHYDEESLREAYEKLKDTQRNAAEIEQLA